MQHIEPNFNSFKNSFDQISLLLKTIGGIFSYKNSTNIWPLLGYFYAITFEVKNCCGCFWSNIENIGPLLSDHLVTMNLNYMHDLHSYLKVL